MKSRNVAWVCALTLPIWFVPLWLAFCRLSGMSFSGAATASGGLLLAMVSVAAYTDATSRRIFNWTSYTGTLWAFGINGYQSIWGNEFSGQMLGAIGISASLIGFAVLFFGLLVIFSFSGGGAGDVKLVGAIGSFLGLKNGFEAALVSFVTCAVFVFGRWALQHGPSVLLGRKLGKDHKSGTKNEEIDGVDSGTGNHNGDEIPANPFKTKAPLAPYFAIGTIVVLLRESGILNFEIIQL